MNEKLKEVTEETLDKPERVSEFAKLLTKTCPILWRVPEGQTSAEKPYVGKGWQKIVLDLSVAIEAEIMSCREIIPLDKFPYVSQVKEKFGGLRFYVSSIPAPISESVSELIRKAENDSYHTCDKCGEPGKARSHWPDLPEVHFGWIRTLCEPHWYEEAEERAKRGSSNKDIRRWYFERMKAKKQARRKKND